MEEPVLTLGAARLQVEPGGQTQLSVTVRNPGHLVESFRLDVVGLDPTWWQVHPPELPVYPGKEESALVVLSPPAQAQAPDTAFPFGVRAVSTLDDTRSVVEEGDLEVGRILDLQAVILPVTSRGRWSGKHQVTYTNWGNSAIHLRLSASDKDGELGFRLVPEQVSVPVGGSARAQVRVRPRKPFLRGAPLHRPFQIVGESGGTAPVGVPRTPAARAGVPDPGRPVLDGALQQLPIISRTVLVLAGLVALGIAGLIAVLFRTSQVPGATVPDVKPGTPTGFTAESPGATVIQLRWAETARAKSYLVQQVEASGAKVKLHPVEGGVTVFADQVDKPSTRRCYTLVAVRADLNSDPSAITCATTRDGKLPTPTDVRAVLVAPGQYKLTWTGKPKNEHVVLVDGAPVGAPTAAGLSETVVAVPAGRHCLRVHAARDPDRASMPSDPPICVDSAAPQPSAGATPGTGTDGGPGPGPGGVPGTVPPSVPGNPTSTASPTASAPSGAALVGWVAVFGPYAEQTQVNRTMDAAGRQQLPARVLQLPAAGLDPTLVNGKVVVVDQLPDQAAAQRVCDGVNSVARTTCRQVNASG